METIIVLILLTLIVNHVGNMTAISASNFLGMEQSILVNFEIQDPDHLIHSTSTESVILCMTECTQNSECLSFSYNIVSLACRLYSAVYGSDEKGTGTTGTRHYNVGEDDRCPIKDGYIHFRNTSGCYKPYPTTSGSYAVATNTCVTDGGHLVKINDVTEKEAIKSVLGASNGYRKAYWTGCYRDGSGGTWVWRDGSAVPLATMFRPGEPSGSGNCAYWSMGDTGFNDFPCGDWPMILCEINMV